MINYNAIIYTLLSQEATITAELATDGKGGKAIYPVRIEQGVRYPAVRYRKGISPVSLKGGDAQRLYRVEFEIAVVAEDPDTCDNIQYLIYEKLDCTTHEEIAGCYVNNLVWEGQEPEIYSDDPDLYLITSRYSCIINKNA